MGTLVPTSLRGLLHYNASARVLRCVVEGCKHLVTADYVRRHFVREHHVSTTEAKQITEYIATLTELRAPSEEAARGDGSAPHPHLTIYQAFQCVRCTYISTSRKWMKVHGNTAHALRYTNHAELFRLVQAQTWRPGKHEDF